MARVTSTIHSTNPVVGLPDLTSPAMLLLVFSLVLGLLVVSYPNRPPGVKSRRNIVAVSPAYPLVGNLPWILRIITQRTRILDEILRLQREQAPGGRPFTLTFPALGGRVTVINNPSYLHHVQKSSFDNYPKGSDQKRIMSDVLGQHGIFCSDGDVWQKQRKLAANIFSANNFRTHVQDTVIKEIGTLDTLLQNAAQKQAHVNLPDLFFRFTLSSFALMAFDADMDCMPTQVERLQIPNEFATSFDFAQMVMDHRIFALLPKWTEWFTREGHDMRAALQRLNSFCYKIIDKRLVKHEKQGVTNATDKQGKDLLELFIERGLNRQELLPVILNFLIAGRDTTAQSLAWLFYELWRSPQHIAIIRQSIEHVLGAPDEQRPLQYDEIKSLPYLHACFYEAVRLWPAVPKNLKQVTKDDIIRPVHDQTTSNLPDVDVRAGESVIWSDWAMARMPEVWGDDCCDFNPKRFLEVPDGEPTLRIKEYSQFKFNSFNAGPRMCLGKTLATYEGMAVAAAVLGRYDVHFDDDQMRNNPPTYQDSLTLPCTPYFVRFTPRATSS